MHKSGNGGDVGTLKLPPRERDTYAERCGLLWSFIIRSPRVCVRCKHAGSIEDFDADHIIKRSRGLTLKFDLENGACLCIPCHREFKYDTSPAGVRRAEAWIQERFSDRLPSLDRKARELSTGFSYAEKYRELWAELARRGLYEDFRAYLAQHPAIAAVWTGME